ncbi:pyridoxal phosphate-dependent transferase [Pisolithus microcarpus]|nr:pyridoxal phosphate-dependent transferase [Pisolithus microcarpus]
MKHFKHEKESEAHQTVNPVSGPLPISYCTFSIKQDEETVPGIEHPGSTGVIYCSDRAMANGFNYHNAHEWANLGQGAPEVGPIPNAPDRPDSVSLPVGSLEYAPTTGVKALREAVANLYNHTYRQGKSSQYTYENVCIVPGGRSGLSRVAAVVSDVYCSYQIPDYTAYDQVLSAFKRLVPVPTACHKYRLDIEQTRRDIQTQGLSVIIASNPRNPTGQVIAGKDLKELVSLSREGTTLILDEARYLWLQFYSWYIYHDNDKERGKSVSSAEYVEDVDTDSIVIIDGLTKNWRLPGWRVCWVIGPKNLITALSQSGQLQLAAIPILDPARVAVEKVALQRHFKMKRDHVLKRLREMHLDVDIPPQATFYVWLNLEKLPSPINNWLGMSFPTFFEELLKEKTIVIPGIFFDINPAHRRNLFNSPCHHFVRLSFGPPLEELDRGLDAIEKVVKTARKEGTRAFGHSYKKSLDSTSDHHI